MSAMPLNQSNPPVGDVQMPPPRSPRAEFWRLLRKNRMAFAGLVVFGLFFLIAVIGLMLTSGRKPLLDPSTVRLQEKLRPPLSLPHVQTLRPDEVPPLGIYLLGTDDLGRDVFSRMLQGAWVSLTVGFVAVGISVFIGIILGGISGYYGQQPIRLGHLLVMALATVALFLLAAGSYIATAITAVTAAVILGFLIRDYSQPVITSRRPHVMRLLLIRTFSVDTLVMRADLLD